MSSFGPPVQDPVGQVKQKATKMAAEGVQGTAEGAEFIWPGEEGNTIKYNCCFQLPSGGYEMEPDSSW